MSYDIIQNFILFSTFSILLSNIDRQFTLATYISISIFFYRLRFYKIIESGI